MKATNAEILAAVDGEICPEQAEKLRIIRSHMDSLELCRLNTESVILSIAEKYMPQINLISTVPGIQTFAAIGVLSEIGVGMSVFPSSKHLCSLAGLTPQNNESAGKKKTTRISHAGAYISNRQISVYIDTREIMKVAEHNGKFCNIPKHGRK